MLNIQAAKLVEVDPTKKYLIILTVRDGVYVDTTFWEEVSANTKKAMSDLGIPEANYRIIGATGVEVKFQED